MIHCADHVVPIGLPKLKKGLTSHTTGNELCTGCCTVHCMDRAGAGHVALNYRNICLGAEPLAKIGVVIIVACRVNATLAESHSHCSNPCTRLNHSQLLREIWVLPLEEMRPIWRFQPDFATNGTLLEIEKDCWTKSWIQINRSEKGSSMNCWAANWNSWVAESCFTHHRNMCPINCS